MYSKNQTFHELAVYNALNVVKKQNTCFDNNMEVYECGIDYAIVDVMNIIKAGNLGDRLCIEGILDYVTDLERIITSIVRSSSYTHFIMCGSKIKDGPYEDILNYVYKLVSSRCSINKIDIKFFTYSGMLSNGDDLSCLLLSRQLTEQHPFANISIISRDRMDKPEDYLTINSLDLCEVVPDMLRTIVTPIPNFASLELYQQHKHHWRNLINMRKMEERIEKTQVRTSQTVYRNNMNRKRFMNDKRIIQKTFLMKRRELNKYGRTLYHIFKQ